MSNAVTSLTTTAAIVSSDFNNINNSSNTKTITLGNLTQVATNNSNIKTDPITDNTTTNTNSGFVSASSSSSNLTNTSPINSLSSSNSESSDMSSTTTSSATTNGTSSTATTASSAATANPILNNTNTNNNNNNINTSLNGATNTTSTNTNNLNVNSYYHPNQHHHPHHQYHHPHLNLNHLHHQPQLSGIQYFQFSSTNSPVPNQASTPTLNGSPLASLTSSPNTTTSFPYHSPHLISPHPNLIHPQAPQQPFQQFHTFHTNYKDTRWLTLEVCREFQRNKCNRNENECKFAHPPAHVEIINGKVIACYDSLKGKCTRKEPPCKYLHPPQHLKDQLLQNGKNNLVLRQVALAMMHQQQQQQQQQANSTAPAAAAATAALIAAAAAANGTNTPTGNQVGQFTQFTTSPNGGGANSTQSAATNSTPATPSATQYIPTTLTNGGLTTFSQVQLANGSGAQPTLFPMIANGFHPTHHQHQLHQTHMQQAIYATTQDPTTAALLQVSAVSPGAAAATANGLLPPQQRTDRLQGSDLSEAAANGGATFTLDNGQTYQIPQFQIYTPIFQRAPNANLNISQANGSNEELNQQQTDMNKAANASATATATVANMVDVVPGKKRQHDAIEQDFIPVSAANLYQTSATNTIPVKRTALTDSKTGMPMFQPFTQTASNQAATLHHLQHAQGQPITITQHPGGAAVAALNYPINFATMQYAPYPPTFSLPYNGHPASLPRI